MEEPTVEEPTVEKEEPQDNETTIVQKEPKRKLKAVEAPVDEVQETPPEVKRKGRPVGAKDSKPRARKVTPEHSEPEQIAPPSPPDPVRSYFEARRMAVERAYHAQSDHWSSLLSHLM